MTEEQQAIPEVISSPEEQIASSQDVIQGLLETLGETWSEIERLKQENAALWQTVSNAGLTGTMAGGSPASAPPARELPETAAAPLPAVNQDPGLGVLIIDDSKLLQLHLRHAVESLGFLVVGVADDGEAGIKLATALNPRLVILDYMMPGMSGLECLRALRAVLPNVRVVVCSSEVTSQVTRALIYAGVNEIITKPVQLTNFSRVVKKWMSDEPHADTSESH